MAELSSRKRVRDDLDDSRFDSPEVKRIKEDLLENFDDAEFFTASHHDLDSFMKSFEEEISSGKSTVVAEKAAAAAVVVDLTSESGESQPNLGYLLEASDDELGIPPSNTSEGEKEDELMRLVSSDSSELTEFWRSGYDDGIPNFDSFELGIGDGNYYNNNFGGGGEYVALDGLFDYSDVGFGSTDFLWRSETLPAK